MGTKEEIETRKRINVEKKNIVINSIKIKVIDVIKGKKKELVKNKIKIIIDLEIKTSKTLKTIKILKREIKII